MDEAMGASIKEFSPTQVPILERLRKQKNGIEQQLANINEAIKVLESNPGFVEALDVLGKVSNRIY